MEKVSKEEVQNVAKLARLNLSETETIKMQKDMSSILDFIGQINEVNTENIEPSTHVLDLKNVFREDIVGKTLDIRKIEELAPEFNNGFIVVPKVIG